MNGAWLASRAPALPTPPPASAAALLSVDGGQGGTVSGGTVAVRAGRRTRKYVGIPPTPQGCSLTYKWENWA